MLMKQQNTGEICSSISPESIFWHVCVNMQPVSTHFSFYLWTTTGWLLLDHFRILSEHLLGHNLKPRLDLDVAKPLSSCQGNVGEHDCLISRHSPQIFWMVTPKPLGAKWWRSEDSVSLYSEIAVWVRVQNLCSCTRISPKKQTTAEGVEVARCPTAQKAVPPHFWFQLLPWE